METRIVSICINPPPPYHPFLCGPSPHATSILWRSKPCKGNEYKDKDKSKHKHKTKTQTNAKTTTPFLPPLPVWSLHINPHMLHSYWFAQSFAKAKNTKTKTKTKTASLCGLSPHHPPHATSIDLYWVAPNFEKATFNSSNIANGGSSSRNLFPKSI